MKKILMIIMMMFVFTLATVPIMAYSGTSTHILTISEVPEEESVVEEVGFFESIVMGFYDFVASPEFTRICTGIAMLTAATYPFVSKWMSLKSKMKYNRLIDKLSRAKDLAEKRKNAALVLAKIADTAMNMTKNMKEALALGFDKSNLKTDVKDKVMNILNSVPVIDTVELNDAIKSLLEDESDNDVEMKDNLSTEEVIPDLVPKSGW